MPRITRKTTEKNSINRLIFVGLTILVQIALILLIPLGIGTYYADIYIIMGFAGVICALLINTRDINAQYKIVWIILILIAPVFGVMLYLMFGSPSILYPMRKMYERASGQYNEYRIQDEKILEEIKSKSLHICNQVKYINMYGKYPIYKNTKVDYFDDAEAAYESQIDDIKKARSYIFMEYHAISEEPSIKELEELLVRKASEGVKVRIIYDDLGCVGFLNKDYPKRLNEKGIECLVFNPMVPVVKGFLNNRDHRKITVIDGKIGYTGGYNIAEEYFNRKEMYGHWKDCGIKMEGDAVKGLLVIFLEMWTAILDKTESLEKYLPTQECKIISEGYVLPYADFPLDSENTGRNVYLNIIKSATRYVHIMTPYLIIDDEVISELNLAAKRGVDVKIITPGIPDKKLVYAATRSYYPTLVSSGVCIFEYSPGFSHGKFVVADDEVAAIGTINFDFRSFYFHFENAVFMYNVKAIYDIERDFQETILFCRSVSNKYKFRPVIVRLRDGLLRMIAPLF